MGKTETEIFIVLTGVVVLVFIFVLILFIFQFRKRRLAHEREKIKLEEQHQLAILNTQVESQQQTMQWIGREIHDHVGQKLTLASLYTRQLESESAQEKINSISRIIDESLTDLRRLSRTLTDSTTNPTDLITLLEREANEINATGVYRVKIHASNGEPFIHPSVKNILFRLLQEFMQNSIKHAACTQIDISIDQANNRCVIRAIDNGKGFDINRSYEGIGLRNMQSRAAQIGAGYELLSSPGNGTQILLTLENQVR